MQPPLRLLLGLVGILLTHPALASTEFPNVVLIITDDQGPGDFSHAGHGQLETPHLDRLAEQSPKVPRFYVSPVCSPTRASLMTGRYHYRTRVVDTWIGRSMMEPDEVTLAEALGEAGYATGIFGKWHLGDCYPLRPMDQGFDESLVHLGGGLAQPSEPIENESRYTNPILFRQGGPVQTEGYCTDVYFDAALAFIDQAKSQERPFFAYVATNAPHDPWHDVPPELYEKYAGKPMLETLRGKSDKADREARICAMVENIDQNVGRLLQHLDDQGLSEDTLVIFLGDNGPVGGRYSMGLRGAKCSVYEGGIRAPLFLRWLGRLRSDMQVDVPAAHIDLFPTILELTGVPLPELRQIDGRSLVPWLDREIGSRADEELQEAWAERTLTLQAHRGNQPALGRHFAVVRGEWKLVCADGFHRASPDQPIQLFNLLEDPAETQDMGADYPEVYRELLRRYEVWFRDVSSTRPDNYLPPRIHLGHPSAPVTTLTKQDLRVPKGEGWNGEGHWWLHAERTLEAEATVIWRKPPGTVRVTLDFAHRDPETGELREQRRTVEFDVEAGSQRTPLGKLELPVGDFLLGASCSGEGRVHQLELTQVD